MNCSNASQCHVSYSHSSHADMSQIGYDTVVGFVPGSIHVCNDHHSSSVPAGDAAGGYNAYYVHHFNQPYATRHGLERLDGNAGQPAKPATSRLDTLVMTPPGFESCSEADTASSGGLPLGTDHFHIWSKIEASRISDVPCQARDDIAVAVSSL